MTPNPTKEQKEKEFAKRQEEMRRELAETKSIPHGKKLAKLLGKVDGDVFEQLYEIAKDTTNITDPMKDLLEVADKFSYRGKFIPRFISALEGGPREREYVKKEVIWKMRDTTGKISEHRENKHIRKLAELREEDQAEAAIQKTGAAAVSITETAQTAGAVSEATRINHENWEKVPSSGEFSERREKAEFAKVELMKEDESLEEEATGKENELKNLQGQLDKAEKEKDRKTLRVEIEKLKKEIADTRKKQFKIDDEIQKIVDEIKEIREEFIDYMTTDNAQRQVIERFSEKIGSDINTVQDLLAWQFKPEEGRKTVPATVGTVIEKEGGETSKEIVPVEIMGIRFDRPKGEEGSVKPGADSPGVLMVRYRYEGEKKEMEASSTIFGKGVNAFEKHSKIDSPEELSQKYSYELRGKDIRDCVGETFSGKRVVEMKDGEPVYEHIVFKIEKVEEVNGKWMVKADRAIVKIPKEWLSKSLHRSAYFDRIDKDFELGAFGAMLRQSRFHRDIKNEEMQEIADMIFAERRKKTEGFIAGASPAAKKRYIEIGGILDESITIPEREGEQTEIIFRVGNKEEKGILIAVDGGYEVILYHTDGYREWGKPIMPKREIRSGARRAPAPRVPKVIKRMSFTNRDLAEAINKGDIQNAAPMEAPEAPRVTRRISADNRNLAGAINKGDIQNAAPIAPPEALQASEESGPTTSIPKAIPTEFPAEGDEKEEVPGIKEAKIHYEALAYDDIRKVGGMETVEKSYLKSLWAQTQFLSVDSFWEMGKAMYEYYQRRFERRQKAGYSEVGKDLPFFAPEMQRIQEASEHEQVNMFKEAFEDKGVFVIQGRMNKTSNMDEFKAAMMVLSESGQMRWDDIDMWKNLNSFVDPALAIPIPSNGDPYSQISETDDRTGGDFLKEAIDSLWGEGTYNEWYSKNKSTYSSNMKGYYEEGKELESVEGGHEKRLSLLLGKHKRGEYIDPHEYEGLIEQAIHDGKSTLATKIFYMIEGVAAQNPQGQTILSFDRIAHLSGEMLHKFPPFEYLTASVLRPDGKTHRFTLDDYKQWASWFEEGDSMKTKPGKAVDDFMWEHMIPSDEMQIRINKDLRNGDNLDHDDMFALLPPASEVVITDACRAIGGNRKILTVEGYANAFPGFSQYMKSLAKNDNKPKLVEAIKSYVRFEGVMMDKFDPQDKSMQRMDDSILDKGTVVTPDKPPRLYIDELNKTVQKVIAAYDDDELTRVSGIIFGEEIGDLKIPENQKKQDDLNRAYRLFGKIFKNVTDRDNGERMRSVLAGANLTGM